LHASGVSGSESAENVPDVVDGQRGRRIASAVQAHAGSPGGKGASDIQVSKRVRFVPWDAEGELHVGRARLVKLQVPVGPGRDDLRLSVSEGQGGEGAGFRGR